MSRARYIVILGPDGSGKTTVADRLEEVLATDFPVRRMNFSFGIMPPVSRMLGRKPQATLPEGQINAGMVKPLGRLKAFLLSVWYGIDHVLGHFTLHQAVRDEVIIFARSYHDFLYQRAYLNLPKFIPRLFLALGPKPTIVATPLRDATVIHEAKPELTIDEINNQYSRIIAELGSYTYFACIEARAGIEETVCQIRERVGF